MKNLTKLTVGALGAAIALIGPVDVIAQGAGAVIEEIVVTGRKREEILTDVPVSISVFNSEALLERGIDSQDCHSVSRR